MISPENREPMSTARKVGVSILAAFAVALMWSMAATIRLSNMPQVNVDGAPDKVVTVPLTDYTANQLGFKNGTPVPLTRQFASEPTGKLELTISKVYRDGVDNKNRVVLASRLGDEWGYSTYPEEPVVKWMTGSAPSIALTFSGAAEARLLYLGQGYGVWRFATFRGSQSYVYAAGTDSTRIEHDTLSEILAKASVVTITLPNTPEWQKLKTVP